MHTGRGRTRCACGRLRAAMIAAALVAAAILAASCGGNGGAPDGGAPGESSASGGVWTCSMHPQVRSDGPGDCPICGMDLIRVEDEAGEEEMGERVLTVSEAGRSLMEIRTTPVRRMSVEVEVEVDLVGKVAYDEDRVSRIAAWVPGRVEKLHVDYVGYEVEVGEPMVDLYGPELLAAQQELIQALSAHDTAVAAGKPHLIESARGVLEAVRERLRLWGLSDGQIAEMELRRTAEPRVTIESPASGTVVEKGVTEGAYVMTGQALFTIADLSVVWIELSAYESELPWLSEGQHIEFETAALPGRTFEGRLSFIEPLVDPASRTVTARAEVANTDGALKPDMFVRATAHVAHGPAEHAAAHGAGHAASGEAPLVIPATAPLLTGQRAVVYVEVEDADAPTFEGREVVLGPRAGDYYIVVSGLHEGEKVVSEGAFKIDSALQIRAKPSMMSPESDGPAAPAAGHQH